MQRRHRRLAQRPIVVRRRHVGVPNDPGDDAVGPIYEFTAQLASLTPPPPELQQLLGAACGNPEAMSDFVSLTTGTVSPVDFFDPANIGRIVGAAVSAGVGS